MLPKLSVASGICTFAHVSLCVCACVCSLTNVHLCTSHRYWDFVTEPRLVAGLSRAKADNCISGAPWPQTKHLCYYFLWPLRKPLPFLRLNFQIDFFSPQSQVMHSWLAVPSCLGPCFWRGVSEIVTGRNHSGLINDIHGFHLHTNDARCCF